MTATASQPKSLADWIANLTDEGYQVKVNPSDRELPESLRGFHPDIVAFREDKNLVIEFRNNKKVRRPEYFHELSEITRNNPDWHFLVATNLESLTQELISIEEINAKLERSKEELRKDNSEAGFLYSWSSIKSTRDILYRIYSDGCMEKKDYQFLMKSLNLRNAFVHGERASITLQDVEGLIQCAYRLLEELASPTDL
jgi:hypothetical protein